MIQFLISSATWIVFTTVANTALAQPNPSVQPPTKILNRAHAHNDYYHKRPLLDALDNGFCSVEADVFLHDDELKVAHTFLEIRKERTLSKLYLDPLFNRVKENGGFVQKEGGEFFLLIDFKSSPASSLNRLIKRLEPHRHSLTRLKEGKLVRGAVTVVISGNRPVKEILATDDRFVFLDGRLNDPPEWSHLVSPLVSESWNSQFRYRGFREMDPDERTRLEAIVTKVHKQKKKIRFWASPDRRGGWQVAFDAGVDLINTDKLTELREFLLEQKK